MNFRKHCASVPTIVLFFSLLSLTSQRAICQTKQPRDVVEAYAVCARFQQILAKNLDFSAAFEETFVRTPARRRSVAIWDGELRNEAFDKVSTELLVEAYKLRMTNVYLTLVLAGPTDAEQPIYFPPKILELQKRELPKTAAEFPVYVDQLKTDVATFRSHLSDLELRNSDVARRIADFKSDASKERFDPPVDHTVQPLAGYFGAEISEKDQPYYEVGSYRVVKDSGQMRIAGIRLFNRMF